MHPIPYLFFNGRCAEALGAYAGIFGSPPPELMTAGQAPAEARGHLADADPALIMHGAVRVGAGWLYASDDLAGNSPVMAGVSVSLSFPDAAEARRVFDALAEGGEVRMDFAPTFWSAGFGALSDRFGTRWMIMVDADAADG